MARLWLGGGGGPGVTGVGRRADDGVVRESWRDELLERAWQALAEVERETGRPLHTVLKFRATNSRMRYGLVT